MMVIVMKKTEKQAIMTMNMYCPLDQRKSTAQSLLTIQEDELFKETFYNSIHSSKPIVMQHVIEIIKKPKLQHLTKKFTNCQLADKVRMTRKAGCP